jgi:2-polyprenyl-3-methyl-5-hydroxy-6-metoxy-1,4-benzoquinol methylase
MMRYSFIPIQTCNMCGSKSESHKILGLRLNQSQGLFPQKKTGIAVTVVKCKQCGLIFSSPIPIPLDIQKHYGVPPETYWVEDYFASDPNYFQSEIAQLKKLLPFYDGMRSLDIGAGLGKAMMTLKNAGFDAYGIEASETFYKNALLKQNIDKNKLVLNTIEDATFPEAHFDFITFGAVLEHLYDPSMSIGKAMSWLKPSGIIHIEIPSSDWLIGKLINGLYSLTLSNYVSNLSPMHPPYHMYEFGLKSFLENSKLNGYEVAHVEYYVCKTFLPRFLDFFLKPYMKLTNSGMQLCVWLRKPKF